MIFSLLLKRLKRSICLYVCQGGQRRSQSRANNGKYLMFQEKIISKQISKSAIFQVQKSQF